MYKCNYGKTDFTINYFTLNMNYKITFISDANSQK